MHILHDQRERSLSPVAFTRLAYRTCRRISPKGFVVRATIIVTSKPEPARSPKDKKCRREQEPGRPPCRLRAEPTVRRIAEKLRRIKWRDVISKEIVFSLKCGPRRINDESR